MKIDNIVFVKPDILEDTLIKDESKRENLDHLADWFRLARDFNNEEHDNETT